MKIYWTIHAMHFCLVIKWRCQIEAATEGPPRAMPSGTAKMKLQPMETEAQAVTSKVVWV